MMDGSSGAAAMPRYDEVALGPAEFRAIAALMYELTGVTLRAGKESLVRTRIARRLRALRLPGFDAYVELLRGERGPDELRHMVDALTTNKTSFFREIEHFRFLERTVLPRLAARSEPLRVWSAGCSSGEEAYSVAMLVRDVLPPGPSLRARILATDVSRAMMARAMTATYDEAQVADIAAGVRARHFASADTAGAVRVVDATRALVRFAPLNLMHDWPMRHPFDVILCRNVMIYFDGPTQQRLVERFTEALAPGGVLLIGHSESLAKLRHELHYVQPSVYAR